MKNRKQRGTEVSDRRYSNVSMASKDMHSDMDRSVVLILLPVLQHRLGRRRTRSGSYLVLGRFGDLLWHEEPSGVDHIESEHGERDHGTVEDV